MLFTLSSAISKIVFFSPISNSQVRMARFFVPRSNREIDPSRGGTVEHQNLRSIRAFHKAAALVDFLDRSNRTIGSSDIAQALDKSRVQALQSSCGLGPSYESSIFLRNKVALTHFSALAIARATWF